MCCNCDKNYDSPQWPDVVRNQPAPKVGKTSGSDKINQAFASLGSPSEELASLKNRLTNLLCEGAIVMKVFESGKKRVDPAATAIRKQDINELKEKIKSLELICKNPLLSLEYELHAKQEERIRLLHGKSKKESTPIDKDIQVIKDKIYALKAKQAKTSTPINEEEGEARVQAHIAKVKSGEKPVKSNLKGTDAKKKNVSFSEDQPIQQKAQKVALFENDEDRPVTIPDQKKFRKTSS